jgi:hypothetical protein
MPTTLACALLMLFACIAVPAAAQPATITGVVVDDRNGQPVAGVLVYVENQAAFGDTDREGRFTLSVPPGRHTIAASVVGYALLRMEVEARSGAAAPVTLRLAEGAGTYNERITVIGARRDPEDEAVGGSALYGRELQNLRGVTLDDPLRAVQALPAATATDDFFSEFAVRGNSWRHVGLAVDGIPSRYLMHSIHGVVDGGSIAMVNSEALGAVSLLPGSYPQRTGRRMGAHVELTTREGSRDGFHGRAGLSGTSATFLGEGPLADGRGSWLFSARRSYLDYLIQRIDPDASFGFGFYDVLATLAYDVSPQHALRVTVIGGRSAYEDEAETALNDEADAKGMTWLTAVSWQYTPGARFSATQRVYSTGLRFDNRNPAGAMLDEARFADTGWRADATFVVKDGWLVEFGGDAQRLVGRHARTRFAGPPARAVPQFAYDEGGSAVSGYAQLRAAVLPRLTVSPGLRVDRWSLTDAATSSPWLSAEYRLSAGTRLRAGTGIYRQFPGFEQVFGPGGGGRSLRPERAKHVDAGVELTLSPATRVSVTAYARGEGDVLWTRGSEPRGVPGGPFVPGNDNAPWANVLDGRGRGVELLLRRDAPGGLSGWAGYGYSRLRYREPQTAEEFWADADQRHTLSLYGNYRLSNRMSINAKYRYGSNYPLLGYLGELNTPLGGTFDGGGNPIYAYATRRNTLRLPAYSRLDLRGDRTFNWSGRRLVVFVEVANTLNHDNRRNAPYGVDRAGRIFNATDPLMPIVPSAGFIVEF